MYVQNKVALITGSASGLGLIYAKELLKHGARGVTLSDVDVTKGNEAVENLTQEFGPNKVIFVKVDVVNKNEVEDAMKKTVEAFGNFDILINNAGIMSDGIWEKEIDINIKGTVHGCFLALEEYLPKYKSDSSEPTIINISSIAGLGPHFFMPVYCGTKQAVIAISKTLATPENYDSQKVRILTICPGATLTPLLHEMEAKSFTKRHAETLKTFLETTSLSVQGPEEVGKAMIKIIENGANGSIWVIEDSKLYEIEIPNQPDLKILREVEL